MRPVQTGGFAAAVVLLTACLGPQSGSGDETGDTGEKPDCNYGCGDVEPPICSDEIWYCQCHASNGWNNQYPCPACSAGPPANWCQYTICDLATTAPRSSYEITYWGDGCCQKIRSFFQSFQDTTAIHQAYAD